MSIGETHFWEKFVSMMKGAEAFYRMVKFGRQVKVRKLDFDYLCFSLCVSQGRRQVQPCDSKSRALF